MLFFKKKKAFSKGRGERVILLVVWKVETQLLLYINELPCNYFPRNLPKEDMQKMWSSFCLSCHIILSYSPLGRSPPIFLQPIFPEHPATKREARCSVYAKNKIRRRPELLWILRLFFPLLILLLMADQKSGIDSFLPFFPFPACFDFSVFLILDLCGLKIVEH